MAGPRWYPRILQTSRFSHVIALIILLTGCAAKKPIQFLPLPPSSVGKTVSIPLMNPAPAQFTVGCCLPPGMKVDVVNGVLVLNGSPQAPGVFVFPIQ